MIFSLLKKSIYHSQKNELCTRRWYNLFLERVHTIPDQKHKLSAEKLYREIVLCYLLPLEVILVSMMMMLLGVGPNLISSTIRWLV